MVPPRVAIEIIAPAAWPYRGRSCCGSILNSAIASIDGYRRIVRFEPVSLLFAPSVKNKIALGRVAIDGKIDAGEKAFVFAVEVVLRRNARLELRQLYKAASVKRKFADLLAGDDLADGTGLGLDLDIRAWMVTTSPMPPISRLKS